MKKLWLILVFCLCGYGLSAQDSLRTIVSLVPQYIFVNGIRIDIDRQLVRNQWITVSPRFYVVGENGSSFFDFDDSFSEMNGFGLGVQHKIFLNRKTLPLGSYLSYGLNFSHYYLEYQASQNIIEKHKIDKSGFDVILGLQKEMSDYLIFDFYTGLGFRYSTHTSEGGNTYSYNDNFLSYGYSGNLLLLGVRVGVWF